MTTYLLHFNNSIEPGYPSWNYGAVGKWRKDFESFAMEIGVELIRGFSYHWEEEPVNVLSSRLDGLLGGLKKNDVIIVHWAFAINDENWIKQFVQRVKLFQAKLVFMISDIESWRKQLNLEVQPEDTELYHQMKREVELLSLAEGLIVHSLPMRNKLEQQFNLMGYEFQAEITYIGPYGYKTEYNQEKRQLTKSIDYAGSLEKAKFLLEIPETFDITVFGSVDNNQALCINNNSITVHQRIDPEGIPFALKSSFGLVWDSDSYPNVTGPYGEYQLVNTPSKLSLYLAANQPVIIWSESPLANYVRQNNLGIVIENLNQLSDELEFMVPQLYDEMVASVQKIGGLIRTGKYIKKAIIDMEIVLLTKK